MSLLQDLQDELKRKTTPRALPPIPDNAPPPVPVFDEIKHSLLDYEEQQQNDPLKLLMKQHSVSFTENVTQQQHKINTPSWVTETSSCNDTTYMNLQFPGTASCPLLFKKETFTNVIFQIKDNFKYIKFEDCVFEASAIWGDLSNVENVRPKYINPEQVSSQFAYFCETPGSQKNPLIFYKVTFAYLNFEMGEVYAHFKECLFIGMKLNGFKNCVFEECIFAEKTTGYTKTPLAFYVYCKKNYTETKLLFGRLEPTFPQKKKKIQNFRKSWKSLSELLTL